MPLAELPLKYRSRRDLPPFDTPDGLLSPYDDDTDPSLDPSSAYSQPRDTSDVTPSTPREDPMPKPKPLNDTQAGASLEKLEPLNPNRSANGSYSGLKKLPSTSADEMPPPGEPPTPVPSGLPSAAPPPPEMGLGDLDRSLATGAGDQVSRSPVTAKEEVTDAEARRAEIQARRPEAPHSNWAQRLGMAVLSMTKLAPMATQIIHPKWAEQEGAYQRDIANEAQLEKMEETQASTEANVAAKEAQAALRDAQQKNAQLASDARKYQADERTRDVLLKSGAIMVNPGEQAPPNYVPVVNPAHPEEKWVRENNFVPIPQGMEQYFPGQKAGDQVSNQQMQKALNTVYQRMLVQDKADNRPVGPDKSITPAQRVAAIAVGVDPNKPVDQWTPQEAQKVQDAIAKQAQQIHVHAGGGTTSSFTPDQLKALNAPLPEGQQTNEAFLNTLPPDEKNAVKAISEYRYPIPQGGFAMRDPKWKKVFDDVVAYDPAFNAQQYVVRQRIQNDFTSGVSSRNIRSLNTVAHHLGVLNDMADALNNRDMVAYNKLANFLATETGNPQVTNFNLAKTAVAGELATAFKGQATDAEIRQWMDGINSAGSAQQLRGAVTTPISLIAGRLHAFESQYKDVMGKDRQFLSPQAQQTLQKLAGGGTKGPAVGTVEGGYRFKGGDPSKQANWEKVK